MRFTPKGFEKKVKMNFAIFRSVVTWAWWLVFEEPGCGGWFLSDHGVLAGVKTKHGMRAKIVNTPVGYRSYVLLPFSTSLPVLCFSVLLQGFAMGFLDTGGNLLLLRLHSEPDPSQAEPYMQAMHF